MYLDGYVTLSVRSRGQQTSSKGKPMTDAQQGTRLLGSLHVDQGRGVVRIEDRLPTDIEDAWTAVTDPARLARWYGEVEGDLRPGGSYHAHVFSSGWDGPGKVEECEPPHRFVVSGQDPDEAEPKTTVVTLTADGAETVLVVEQTGVPENMLAGYGAGEQVLVEDLGAYLRGEGRCDSDARMDVLFPAYEEVPVQRTP